METEVQIMSHRNNVCSKYVDIFDGGYYSINRRFLSIIGLWPYQSVTQRNAILCFITICSCSCFWPQMRSMILTWGTLDTFIACFTPLLSNVVSFAKVLSFTYYSQEIKKLLETMQNDWKQLQDTPQIKILHQHAETGKTFTMLDFSVCCLGTIGWVLTPLVPKLLDVLSPLNHSRPRIEMIPTDYMVDPDEYFYPIYFHLASGSIIVILIYVSVDTFYMCIAQHVCGMFEVLRHDLENMQEDEANTVPMINPNYHHDSFYYKIVSCIKKHKVLIEYVNIIQSTCEWILFVVILLSMVDLSFLGYQAVAKESTREDVVRSILFAVAQIFHLYIITLPSHWISDSSSFLPISAYTCRWYRMSVRSRRLVILLIRASIQPCSITAGKIYVMSIENFCCVLRTSLSYVSILISLQ